ncbi:MAG TPA: ATP-binding protein [Gemmatimonadaceae bacterium]|jgi:AAA+ superfamily predicted ATPase
MARSDLLISLLRAGATGNDALFRRAAEALIAEERSRNHSILADQLAVELDRRPPATQNGGATTATIASPSDFFTERIPRKRLTDLVLDPSVLDQITEVVEEQHRAEILRAHNVEPRHRILLTGPPGNGKTSLAEALATELMVPFCSVRYDSVIGSYLGETTTRLKRLFDYFRHRPSVLFFDEFDTLGKERGDTHDTGEIKRVVSSLLLQIDELPPYVCVVTATNHPELLDRAVWRRFQLRLDLRPPTAPQRAEFLRRLAERMDLSLSVSPMALATTLGKSSYSELEQFLVDVARRYVLGLPDSNLSRIVKSRLIQWRLRAKSPTNHK